MNYKYRNYHGFHRYHKYNSELYTPSYNVTNPQKKEPPHNTQAEEAVLGAIFLDNSALDTAMTYLQPQDFYVPANKSIYACMCELNTNNMQIDSVTISDALKNHNQENKQIFKYVAKLATSVPTASNIKYYAKIVQNKSLGRKLLQVAQHITDLGYQHNDHPDKMLDDAESKLLSISRLNNTSGLQPVNKITQQSFNRLKSLEKNHTGITGEPTGFKYVDKLTTGLHGGQFMVIAARPSMGKTTIALNIAQNLAELTHKTVAIFSLEMRSESLVDRMLCANSNVDAMHVRQGQLTQNEANRFVLAANQLSKQHIYIDDTPSIPIGSILARSRRLDKQSKGNLGLIVVDYLQLVDGDDKESRQQEVSSVSRQLKRLAIELDVPVIALSQLSRSVDQRENKRPVLDDIRESGSIEQDADIVSFLYRKDYYIQNTDKKEKQQKQNQINNIQQKADGDPSITEFIIEKNRSGPRGTVKLMFFKAYNKFNTIDVRKFTNNLTNSTNK